MRAYEYRHFVGFEETNLVGNVYYVNHLRWQGRCREMFLREHCPEVLDQLGQDLSLVTTRCTCEYLTQLSAFDEVIVRMRLGAMAQNRLEMLFEYWRVDGSGTQEELAARGEQEIACLRREGATLAPAPIPEALSAALRLYAALPEASSSS